MGWENGHEYIIGAAAVIKAVADLIRAIKSPNPKNRKPKED